MSATLMTTISDYATEVTKRLGRQYSLYTDRAVELLPEAIRLTLLNGAYDETELFKDNDDNGTIIQEMVINIPAQLKTVTSITRSEVTLLHILTTIHDIVMVTSGYDFSLVSPEEFNSIKYRQFDTSRPQFAGYIDSNQLVVYNPTSPLTTAQLSVTFKRTQFIDSILKDTNTNIVDYFSYNLLLQIVATGAELLKKEITL